LDQENLSTTRTNLHRVCAHVLGRRRFEVSGRFGLRAGPLGITTPAFGEAPEVVRIFRTTLVHEVGGSASRTSVKGSTLRELAGFVGVDLGKPFSSGEETPPVGDVDAPIELSDEGSKTISDWFAFGWGVLDTVLAALPERSEVSTIQLWPEHFDAATTVTAPGADPVNLGFSPGDSFEQEPYLYVGPWGAERPGDVSFWNAPFGAVRTRAEMLEASDPSRSCERFLATGLGLVREASSDR